MYTLPIWIIVVIVMHLYYLLWRGGVALPPQKCEWGLADTSSPPLVPTPLVLQLFINVFVHANNK